MSKVNLAKTFKSVGKVLAKHGPEILTGIGIGLGIATPVLAVRNTPKALKLIEAKKEELEVETLTPAETVKTTWKCYIPAAATGVASVACILGANTVSGRRSAALATAYSLSETALREYKDKVVETIGEKKEREVRDAIAQDKIDRNPVKAGDIIITEKGNTLCYDVHSGRYFKSDLDKLKKAVNEINYRLINECYISLNEFYYVIGLEETQLGDDLGWRIESGLLDFDYTSKLTDDGTPCIVIDYNIAPKYGYDKLLS